jgi:hypothetical protein
VLSLRWHASLARHISNMSDALLLLPLLLLLLLLLQSPGSC